MHTANDIKEKCGTDAYEVLNFVEQSRGYWESEGETIEVDENYDTETTTITFEDGSKCVVNNSDVEYFD